MDEGDNMGEAGGETAGGGALGAKKRASSAGRMRLDALLVERGLAPSRTKAQALVMAGEVRVSGQVERKPSRGVPGDAVVEVATPPRFVSRGGEKLEGAFALWGGEGGALCAQGRICLDVGSSTGGFTDCLLQHGAARVLAVDVGTNQLAYSLRVDPRVWVRENFNARYMTRADLPETPSLAVTDVSFISLRLILPAIAGVIAPGGLVIALIKPQFEVGKGNAPGGLVRDERLRLEARDAIVDFAQKELSFELLGLAESPVPGREMGNIEYLSFWRAPAAAGGAAGE